MSHVSIDLLVLSAFGEQSAKYAHTLHPGILDWGTRVGTTQSLTGTGVVTLSSRKQVSSYTQIDSDCFRCLLETSF